MFESSVAALAESTSPFVALVKGEFVIFTDADFPKPAQAKPNNRQVERLFKGRDRQHARQLTVAADVQHRWLSGTLDLTDVNPVEIEPTAPAKASRVQHAQDEHLSRRRRRHRKVVKAVVETKEEKVERLAMTRFVECRQLVADLFGEKGGKCHRRHRARHSSTRDAGPPVKARSGIAPFCSEVDMTPLKEGHRSRSGAWDLPAEARV